jgi:tRNA pseudouridine38-40 synthase
MRRLRATLEYDGTDFVGWQSQSPERGRAVQDVVEAAIARITGARPKVVGAGRTDAGVHATGQVAHFDSEWPGELAVLRRALAAVLPADVVVTELVEAAQDFHARFSAREREYVYTLLNRPLRSPLWTRTAWHVPEPLDQAAMQAAGARLVGRHDFRAFGRPMRETGSTVRTVTGVETRFLEEDGFPKVVKITVRADAFLRSMVRRMVYALVEVGRGRLTPDEVAAILAAADPAKLHGIAPPQGLCLTRVVYEETGNRE